MKLILYLTIIILLGCSETKQNSNNTFSKYSIEIKNTDSVNIQNTKQNNQSDSINDYLDYPLDFHALKKATEHMHSGGSIRIKEDYFYKVEDPAYVYYDYWAIEFSDKIEGFKHPLSFKVLKPFENSEDRKYSSDNEILIGIKSRINWEGLGQSNFVGNKIPEITNKFGKPDFDKNECLIYHNNGKMLILKTGNDKVKWFKYLWFKDTINIDELPDECFQWIK